MKLIIIRQSAATWVTGVSCTHHLAHEKPFRTRSQRAATGSAALRDATIRWSSSCARRFARRTHRNRRLRHRGPAHPGRSHPQRPAFQRSFFSRIRPGPRRAPASSNRRPGRNASAPRQIIRQPRAQRISTRRSRSRAPERISRSRMSRNACKSAQSLSSPACRIPATSAQSSAPPKPLAAPASSSAKARSALLIQKLFAPQPDRFSAFPSFIAMESRQQ